MFKGSGHQWPVTIISQSCIPKQSICDRSIHTCSQPDQFVFRECYKFTKKGTHFRNLSLSYVYWLSRYTMWTAPNKETLYTVCIFLIVCVRGEWIQMCDPWAVQILNYFRMLQVDAYQFSFYTNSHVFELSLRSLHQSIYRIDHCFGICIFC